MVHSNVRESVGSVGSVARNYKKYSRFQVYEVQILIIKSIQCEHLARVGVPHQGGIRCIYIFDITTHGYQTGNSRLLEGSMI
ncbi:MAG: hypothetical protein AB4080_24005 [Trichodesmium sp.]